MEQKSFLSKPIITYGIYLAVISILISVVIWAGGLMEKMGIWGGAIIGFVSFIIYLVLLVLFSKAYRDKYCGGFISFKDAFIAGFTMMILSAVIVAVYNFIFNSFIDPGYMERIMLAMQNKTVQMLESKGMSQEIIDQTIAKFQEKGIPSAGKQVLQNLLSGVIMGAILSVISAAIVKKKNEEAEIL